MKDFWQQLKKPFFVLAPMEDVTDTVFRRVIKHAGMPDVFFTEFTNVEGLFSEGASFVSRRLKFTQDEHPLIAQIWGLNPEAYYKAAMLLVEQGFDGIDINMGCPVKDVTSKGACSALIKNPSLAKELIQAVKAGINDQMKDEEKQIPLSVKTRIGFNTIQTTEWIGFLLEQDIDALTVHGRTAKEMSKVPAHWDEIGKAVQLRNSMKKQTVIIGNGDIKSLAEGREKAKEHGIDGIMIGRGVFENAWIFNEAVDPTMISIKERLNLLSYHMGLYENLEGDKLPFQTLKKYFKIYIRDFDGAGEMRTKLMETNSLDEAKRVLLDLGI